MHRSPDGLSNVIRKEAQAMGFDVVGFTKLDIFEEGDRLVDRWVSMGRHGTMEYMERFKERRKRLLEEIPGAQKVICLGVNYYSEENGLDKKTGVGKVARYAWGRDYHHVIRDKHLELEQRLRQLIDEPFKMKSCVDTQAIPERFTAKSAGLGFIGKHTGILNQKYGPWLFLSEILTDLNLAESEPSVGDCGTCNDCQTHCPTGALDSDYEIDARLCIAYLTIEHRGMIPLELRPKMNNWVFGCDECLLVCPFRSKEKQNDWSDFRPERGAGPTINLWELFTMKSNKAFERKYEGTPLKRTGLQRLQRNACVALGNSRDQSAVELLRIALKSKWPVVRAHAVWAIGQVMGSAAKNVLKCMEQLEEDPDVVNELKTIDGLYEGNL